MLRCGSIRKKKLISKGSEFTILPYIPKIENSEISESFILLKFLVVYIWNSIFFKKTQIFFIRQALYSVDTSLNKYIFLQYGNILHIIYFCWKQKHSKRLWKQYSYIIDIKSGIIAYFLEYWIFFLLLLFGKEKMANKKLKNLRYISLSFSISEFSVFWPEDKIENSGLKIIISEVFEFSTLAILYVCMWHEYPQPGDPLCATSKSL